MTITFFSDDYSLVIERSNGVWHTSCHEKSTAPTPEELVIICEKMGYKNVTTRSAEGRVIDSTAREVQNRYRQAPTKAKVINPFSALRVNDNFEIGSFKPSRPLNKIAKWDDVDKDNCFLLEINCIKK